MLYANSLGLEVIMPAYPLDGRRRRGLAGLGAYVEGPCKEGKDFICGPVNGVHSCRPCTSTQLAVFKDLQGQLNRIIKARGFKASYLLKIDGRIGPLTAAALGAVSSVVQKTLAAPEMAGGALAAAQRRPTDPDTHRLIAIAAPEIDAWLAEVAAMSGASPSVPQPPTVPSDGGDGPIPTPGSGTEPPITSSPVEPVKKPGAGPMLAIVGGVVGLGLIGYGIKRYRERHG